MHRLYLGGLTAALLCSVAFAAPNDGGSADPAELIRSAVNQLDAEHDGDWTAGGLPSLDRVGEIVGRKVSRQEVADAAPGVLRPSTDQSGATKNAGPTDADTINQVGPVSTDPKVVEDTGPIPGLDPSFREPAEGPTTAEQDPGVQTEEGEHRADRERIAEAAKRRVPTFYEIAEACPDPVLLLEAAAHVAGGERWQRNSTLQTIIRSYAVSQAEIKATQTRVDVRLKERADAQAAAAAQVAKPAA